MYGPVKVITFENFVPRLDCVCKIISELTLVNFYKVKDVVCVLRDELRIVDTRLALFISRVRKFTYTRVCICVYTLTSTLTHTHTQTNEQLKIIDDCLVLCISE